MADESKAENDNDLPIANVKDYIVKNRKAGTPEEKILSNLKGAKWPEDIINFAIEEANSVVPPNVAGSESNEGADESKPEEVKEESSEGESENSQEAPAQQKPPTEKEELSAVMAEHSASVNKISDELNKGPDGKPAGRKVSIVALSSILFVWIPFLGSAIAAAAWDNARKNKQIGGFMCLITIIINIILSVGLIYIVLQIFSLDPENLSGISKYLGETFNLV